MKKKRPPSIVEKTALLHQHEDLTRCGKWVCACGACQLIRKCN